MIHRMLSIVALAAVACSTYAPGSATCEESAAPLAPGEASDVGISAEDVVSGFPSWDVRWTQQDGQPMLDEDDVVSVSLEVVAAADVVSDGADIRCRPAGTEFLRVDVAGSFGTDDGALSGALSGRIEAENADSTGWTFQLVAGELTLTGDDLALAENLTAETDVTQPEGYSAAFARSTVWGDDSVRLGVDVFGRTADQSRITAALWHASSLTPQ